MLVSFALGDIVQMKKPHPCGSNRWQIIRVGADVKIKCMACGRVIMLERHVFEAKAKKLLESGVNEAKS
ncbi:MAG: DUF951 domain-containing protein [Christensenellales bacterium]|jgi:hypothetical protein